MTMRVVVDNGPGKRRASTGRSLKSAQPQIVLRAAVSADAPALHALIASHLEEGRLALVPDSPEFSYSAYAVHSTKADEGVMARIRTGLRAAAAITA